MIEKTIRHASTVSVSGQAVLIFGASGSGKSALALDLISRGADLISDDQTIIEKIDGCLIASAPASISGQIEARGVGILAVATAGPCPIKLAVDLDTLEPQRLPKRNTVEINDVEVDVIYGANTGNLAPAILVWLKGGRIG